MHEYPAKETKNQSDAEVSHRLDSGIAGDDFSGLPEP
tara:strand:- start:148 stop:258 length:111 start_codon:yes stop_codon:yes gene_type:complete